MKKHTIFQFFLIGCWVSFPLIVLANDPPTITEPSTVQLEVNENQIDVTTIKATDQDGDTLTFTISGGDDKAFFKIDGNSGVVTFKNALNFEKKEDKGANNIYNFTVKVDDGNGGLAVKDLEVKLTDVNDPPVNIIGNKVKGMEEDTTLTIKDIRVEEEDTIADFKIDSVELSVRKGILEVNKQGGTATIDKSNDKKVTIKGDLAQINKALSSFNYKPGAPNEKGEDTLKVFSADKKGGTATDKVPIQVAKSKDSVCNPHDPERPKGGYGGDLTKNLSVGTVASYSVFRYNLADKKASFNAKAVGGGLSFRYYTDNQLTNWGNSYLRKPMSTKVDPVKGFPPFTWAKEMGRWAMEERLYDTDSAESTKISDIPAGCRAQTEDLLNAPGKIISRVSFAPVFYAFQDKDDDEVGLQLGFNLGFFNDILTLGVGWNLSGDDAGEWFVLLGPSFGFQF